MAFAIIVVVPLVAAACVVSDRVAGRVGALIALAGSLLPLAALVWLGARLANPTELGVLVDGLGVAGINLHLAEWFAPGEVPVLLSARADWLAIVAATTLTVVAVLSTIWAVGGGVVGRELAPGLAIQGLAAATLLADDLLLIAVGWQAVTLVADRGLRRDVAGMIAWIGNIALLLAALMLAWEFGTLVPAEVSARAAAGWLAGLPRATLAALPIVVAVASRLAIIPLHGWLERSAAAPPPARVVWVAAQALLGTMVLLRLHLITVLGGAALALLTGVAAVTVLSAAATAAASRPGSRALAWGAVSQLALAGVGFGTGAFAFALLHIAAFLIVFAALHAGGLAPAAPGAAPQRTVARWVIAAAWVGVPFLTPLAATREAILWRASFDPTGNLSLWGVLAMAGAFNAAAAWRWLVEPPPPLPPGAPSATAAARAPVARTTLATVLAAALIVVAGTSGWFRLAGRPAGLLARPFESPEVRAWIAASNGPDWFLGRAGMFGVELLLVGLGVLTAFLMRRAAGAVQDPRQAPLFARLRDLAAAGWHADEVLTALARRPLLAIARRSVTRVPAASVATQPGAGPPLAGLLALAIGLAATLWLDDLRTIGLAWLAAAWGAVVTLPRLGRRALVPSTLALLVAGAAIRVAAAGQFASFDGWSLLQLAAAGGQGAASTGAAWLTLAALVVLLADVPRRALRGAADQRLDATVAVVWWFVAAMTLVRIVPRLFTLWWVETAMPLSLFAALVAIVAPVAAGAQNRRSSSVGWLMAAYSALTFIGLAMWGPQGALAALLTLIAGAIACLLLILATEANAAPAGWVAAAALAGPIAPMPAFAAFAVLLMAALARVPWLVPLLALAALLAARAGLHAARREVEPAAATGPRRAAVLVLVLAVGAAALPRPLIGAASLVVQRLFAAELRFDPIDPELGTDRDRVADGSAFQSAPRLARSAAQVAQEEPDVRRSLGEATHEPGVPAGAVAHVDP